MLTRLLSRYWLLLPILIVVVFAIDSMESPDAVELEQTIDMRNTRSDYYLAEFKTRKYGADGVIEYTVRGDTLAHYPDTDRSEIKMPQIELHRPGAQWAIRSDSGQFDTDPDLFTLQGDVVVQRRGEDKDLLTIRTTSLTVSPESNTVNTQEFIEVVADSWRLQARGLSSAIDDGNFKLLADVTGRYEIPQ